MLNAIVVGAGFAGSTHWIPAITKSNQWELIGVVESNVRRLAEVSHSLPKGCWTAESVRAIPDAAPKDAVAWVVTPDHLPVVKDLAAAGFTRMVIEKPLVAREREVGDFLTFAGVHDLKVYALDHYLQKALPVFLVLNRISEHDPHVDLVSFRGEHSLREIIGALGEIEGASLVNVEAGELGIPYLDQHPDYERDLETGGAIRDLGPHAFAPLIAAGLLHTGAPIHDVSLARLVRDWRTFVPVRKRDELEMWVTVLFEHVGRSVNVSFGKVPMKGGERSLTVRGKNGFCFLALPRNRDAVLMTNDGRTTRLALAVSTNDAAVAEVGWYFEGRLPASFDGYLHAACRAIELGHLIREAYFKESLR